MLRALKEMMGWRRPLAAGLADPYRDPKAIKLPVHPAMHVEVLAVRGGQVTPLDGSPVPLDSGGVVRFPAYEADIDLGRLATRASATAARVAPWATVVLAPAIDGEGIEGLHDGGLFGLAAGAGGRDTAFVAYGHVDGGRALYTLHHELWHIIEHYLPASVVRMLDRELAGGLPVLTDYERGDRELRADAYAHYAAMRDRGVRVRYVAPDGHPAAADVFCAAYEGDYSGLAVAD